MTSDELPTALADALTRDPAAAAAFEKLPPSHRREYVDWIAEAKREETRARRVEQALAMLREGAKPWPALYAVGSSRSLACAARGRSSSSRIVMSSAA